jgi:ABC-type Zn uptake system ZnuABC Zn-binding protein ZnuA
MATPSSRPRPGLTRTLMVLMALATVVFGACGTGAPSGTPAATDRLKVVATTTVFADIIRNIGGDRVTVTSIIPAGAGPEDYEPSPDDARKLADADLIVSNGVGLDDFLDKLIDATGESRAPRLVLGDGIPTIKIGGEDNPHFWLDPSLVETYYLPAITAKLSALDPADASVFESNRMAYASKLAALDAADTAALDVIPPANRKLVTAHDAFPYFAKHYGFELDGVILANVGQEPTAAELAALVKVVKAAGVPAIFSESQFSPELATTLADEAGITKVVTTLFNDTLGPPPADTYIGMMQWNIQEIVKALR